MAGDGAAGEGAPLWLDSRTACEVFDWRPDPSSSDAVVASLFADVLEVAPDFALGVHVDEVSGLLSLSERPGGPSDDPARDLATWERARLRCAAGASQLAGRPVRSYLKGALTYRFRFHRFVADDWARLAAAYRSLPGWCGDGYDLPRWFGLVESAPPFLWASAESFGLECFGVLVEEDWARWHEAFVSSAAGLPALRAAHLAPV